MRKPIKYQVALDQLQSPIQPRTDLRAEGWGLLSCMFLNDLVTRGWLHADICRLLHIYFVEVTGRKPSYSETEQLNGLASTGRYRLVRQGDFTICTVLLFTAALNCEVQVFTGASKRRQQDPDNPDLGADLALRRALRSAVKWGVAGCP